MKKKLATSLLAGALSASMVIPAFATATPSNGVYPVDEGTKVFAGVIVEDVNPLVRVEVPTLFAFVVNGTTTGSTDALFSGTGGNIILPNAKVVVDQTSSKNTLGGYDYKVTYDSNTSMSIINYSTFDNAGIREGLGLKINGEIQQKSDVSHYWVYNKDLTDAHAAGLPGNVAEFKNYRISIAGIDLRTEVSDGKTTSYKMDSDLTLKAPDTGYDIASSTYTNLVKETQLAENGSFISADFNVVVGGQRGQYKQVEQSAQIGTIVWTVSVDIDNDLYETAPDNEYLKYNPDTNLTTPGGN